jgi:hypothetical protein
MLSDDIRFTMNTNKMSMAGNAFIKNVLDEVIKLEKENETLKQKKGEILLQKLKIQMENIKLQELNNELLQALKNIPCNCNDGYRIRNMIDPFCPKCNYVDNELISKAEANNVK